MKNIKPINHHTFIIESIDKNKNNYSYSILANNEIKHLIDFENVDSLTSIRCTFNEYYLIIYTCNAHGSENSPKIEIAYDLEEDEILDLNNNLQIEYALENMLLFGHHFSSATILQAINEKDLGVCSKEDLDEFFNFMKESNEEVNNRYIVTYIIRMYPNLKKYMNIQKPLTYKEATEIFRSMPSIILNSIPQSLDFMEPKYKLTKKSNGR